jgi:hypothetical protein
MHLFIGFHETQKHEMEARSIVIPFPLQTSTPLAIPRNMSPPIFALPG